MNTRNRILILMGILLIASLCWYLFSTNRSSDLQLIGTVDANEVVVSSRIPGRLQTLAVDEGDTVTAGLLIATIQSDDLAAARNAAEATASSQHYKLQETQDTQHQTQGSTTSQVANAQAQLQVAHAALVQAEAQYERQEAGQQPNHRPRETGRHEPAIER
jgi:HlyD family secretion protein